MRLALLALLLMPAAAHAAPVIYGAIEAFGFITTVAGGFFGYAALALGVKALGDAARRRQERAARDAYNNSLNDRTVTNVATENPYVYVYGRARVGSSIIAIFTSGDNDQYKHLVCVHAAHECDAIEEIYINGKALGTLDADGNVTSGDYYDVKTNVVTELHSGTSFSVDQIPDGSQFNIVQVAGEGTSVDFTRTGKDVVLDADYGNVFVNYTYQEIHARVRVQKHLGIAGDPVDAYLYSILPAQWPTTATVDGFCYTVVTLDLNQPEFQGGIPPIEVLLRGKKLYDPRTETTAWSQNPALAIYDYLTSELCGVDAADIPADYLIAAANACDESVVSAEVYGELGPRYTLSGTVTSDQAQQDVLEKMAQSMAGGIASTTWEMWAGTYVAPVVALYVDRPSDMGDVVGQIAITPGVSDADLYNGVKGQYISGDNSYVATDFEPYQNSDYLAADQGVEKWTNIDFPFTDKKQRVWNLARIFTEDQRNGYTVRAEFSLKAWSLKIGQRVTLTSAIFGWDAKVFRVIGKKFSPTMPVELTLKEDAPSIWDFTDEALPDATPNTNLPNPFAIAPLASLTCTSGTDVLLIQADGTIVSRIKATWPAATTQAVLTNGQIELQWQELGAAVWENLAVAGAETEAFISPVNDGRFYIVRARTVNPYLNTRSDWVYSTHQVIGKTEPPPNITDLTISGAVLSWTPVVALDLAGYVFRFHYGSNFDWGSAAPLHSGLVTQAPFDLVTRPGGVVTIMGKAVDTSGNESQASGNIVTNLGDPTIANVVEVIDLQAQSFPGTVTGGALVGGDLLADATDSAYGTDNQSFFGLDNDPAYDLSFYAQMVYTSGEISVASALAGSVATLSIDSQGADLTIEYRFSGPGPAYGSDSDSAYGADGDPFFDAPGSWIPWPGQIVVSNEVYQFRVTVGAGATRGQISALSLTIDAPDMVEDISDLAIDALGTAVPYTSAFTAITNIQATLQAGASGAVSIEIDKTNPLAPVAKAYNASHVAIGGATADIRLKGY
jgi:hypothetical protein